MCLVKPTNIRAHQEVNNSKQHGRTRQQEKKGNGESNRTQENGDEIDVHSFNGEDVEIL
jgi:hypothetical protein